MGTLAALTLLPLVLMPRQVVRTGNADRCHLNRRAAFASFSALVSGGSASVLLAQQVFCAAQPLDCGADCIDPLVADLRSSNELAQSHRELEQEWESLRRVPADDDRTATAFSQILYVRQVIDRADRLASAQRLSELEGAVTLDLVRELERAATVLATSAALSPDDRKAIGWQWGACGWRQCGAQADAAQSLCKLRANLGMVVPLEARFYLDVAKRSLDEVLQIGVSRGFVRASALPAANYLPRETLQLILPAEELQLGDANIPVLKGGGTEAEGALEEYEARMLDELAAQSSDAPGVPVSGTAEHAAGAMDG